VIADRSLIADFVVQAHEHLDVAEPLLLELEKSGQAPAGAIDEIFRAVHSIKGAAGFLALEAIQDLSHVLEGLLMRLRDGDLAWRPAFADPLLRSLDHLRELLAGLPEDPGELDRELIGRLEGLGSQADPADRLLADCEAQHRRGHELVLVPLPEQAQARAAFETRLRRFGELVRRDFPRPHCALLGSPLELDLLAEALGLELAELHAWDPHEAPAELPEPETLPVARAPDSIRVRVALLDRLMDLAGELVLARNQLRQIAGGPAKPLFQSLDRIATELQDGIMATRLQPIRVLFDRLPRLVRDIGRHLGKAAEVEIHGGDVELDRSLLEALTDPLTHLLRNALDHGFETASERARLGKPAVGRLALRALAEQGRVRIEVQDDGAGIDLAKVRAAALQRGVLTPEQASSLSERDALALIFSAGVSTAEGVSELSGRGVGLDVVRTNIERLGGQIDVESRPALGTRFRIDLPLTLAIVPALIVTARGEQYALPQANAIEVVRLRPGAQPERVRGREVLRLRGRLLAVVRLAEVLGAEPGAQPRRARERAVVLRCGSGRFALVVEGLEDGEEIVVKPLPSALAECSRYSGCTILGDGRPALILDPTGIARSAGLRPEELPEERAEPLPPAQHARSLVLFDAAAGERFAVPLDALLRLETLAPGQIERVGEREFFAHHGRALPLLRLHDLLPVGRAADPADELFVLIPRALDREVGIAAARIVDTVVSDARPDPAALVAPGIVGSAMVEDRLTLFLDPAALAEAAGAASAL
jgi:two-component system chemotaxis sensor kinase CheA